MPTINGFSTKDISSFVKTIFKPFVVPKTPEPKAEIKTEKKVTGGSAIKEVEEIDEIKSKKKKKKKKK